MSTLMPKGARITPLPIKLSNLDSQDVDESWFGETIKLLRGGDGGEHGLLLYKLVRALSREAPPVILDIGTARGFSAIIMARALLDANLEGTVYTVDVIEHQTELIWHGHKHDPRDSLANISISRSGYGPAGMTKNRAAFLQYMANHIEFSRTGAMGLSKWHS